MLSNFLNGGSVSNIFNMGPVNLSFTLTAFNSDGCSYSIPYTVLSAGSSENDVNAVVYHLLVQLFAVIQALGFI